MSIYAKVSLAAVANFKNAVNQAMSEESQFRGAVNCLRELHQYIQHQATTLRDVVSSLENAQNSVEKKIVKIKEYIAELTSTLNDLEEELDAVMQEIEDAPATFSEKDSEGNTYEVENPAYTALCAQAEELERKISDVRQEIAAQERLLHHAQSVLQKIESHHATVVRSVDSLARLGNDCVKVTEDIENIRDCSIRQTGHAYDLLVKIEQIINEYLAIKLLCENVDINYEGDSTHSCSAMGIDKCNGCVDDPESMNNQQSESGFFTEYIDRINQTPKGNSPNGFWTGLRGESIFVPSLATEKGRAGWDRLKSYGLLGIKYSNGEPDYSDCSEGTVIIEHMTADRTENFEQADTMLADQWNTLQRDGKNDWTDEDVENFRRVNKLSWHECCDTKTMHLVSRDIHGCETSVFLHSGGVAECKRRDNNRGGFDE